MASENGPAVVSEPSCGEGAVERDKRKMAESDEVRTKAMNGEITSRGEEQDTSKVGDKPLTDGSLGNDKEKVLSENGDSDVVGKEKEDTTKAMERALNLDEGEEERQSEKLSFEGVTPEIGGRAKWLERQRQREEKNKRLSKQKDGSYFSYMFLEKIFRESRKCKVCGSRDSGKPLTDDESSLELYVSERGVCGRQRIICSSCGAIEPVISCDTMAEIPDKPEYRIDGSTVRYYCKMVTHYEVLHDLMEMLHIAALENDKVRKQKHSDIAEFMLFNARKVCKEWCKLESTELRQKRFLRLRDETLLIRHKPVFMADHTDEYKEMYEMMAGSFRQHREKVKLLLELLKTTLFDNPTQSSFMLWVSIAMMHSENYQKFKSLYDPKTFMQVDSTEYQALKDRYLALNVALGIKKIPIVFILFELPRFYHYIEFLKERVGKDRPTSFLTDEDKRTLEKFDRQAHKYVMKRKMKSGKLVSAESHLDLLTQREEMDRELMFRSTRGKGRAKQDDKKRQKKTKKEQLALDAPGKMSSELKEDERVSTGGSVVKEFSAHVDDFERQRRDAEMYRPLDYDYRHPWIKAVRERTSLDRDMVGDMTIRRPYTSKIELLIEEEDRLWGLEGHWSRKDVLLAEEDILFERKVSMRLNKPEKSVLDSLPVCVQLPSSVGQLSPAQSQFLALFGKLFVEEVVAASFDGACDKLVQMKLRNRKRMQEREERFAKDAKERKARKGYDRLEGKEDKENVEPENDPDLEENNQKEATVSEKEKEATINEKEKEATVSEKEKEATVSEKEKETTVNEKEKEATVNEKEKEAMVASEVEIKEGEGTEESSKEKTVGKDESAEHVTERMAVEEVADEEHRDPQQSKKERGNRAPDELNDSNSSSEYVEAKEELEYEHDGTVKTKQPSTDLGVAEDSSPLEREERMLKKEEEEEKDDKKDGEKEEKGDSKEGTATTDGESPSVAAEEEVTLGDEDEDSESTEWEYEYEDDDELPPHNVKLREELRVLLEGVEWNKSLKANEALNRVKKERGMVDDDEPVDKSGDVTTTLHELLNDSAAVANRYLKTHGTTIPEAKPSVPPRELNEQEEQLVDSITDVCMEYLNNMPRLQERATAAALSSLSHGIQTGQTTNESADDGMVAMVTKVTDDVLVAIVTTKGDANKRCEGLQQLQTSIVPLEEQVPVNSVTVPSQLAIEPPRRPAIENPPRVEEIIESSTDKTKKVDSSSQQRKKSEEESTSKQVSESETTVSKKSSEKENEAVEGAEKNSTESLTDSLKKEDPKKKPSKKKNKKIEKKAKQLVEAVQRRKAMEERYWQKRVLKRTESQEALDRLMEKRDCTLDQLTPEEKRVLMDHVRKSKNDPYHRDWDRKMLAPNFKSLAGSAGMRSRLRAKLHERRMDDEYSPPRRSYRRSEETKIEPKIPEPKIPDPPKSKSKRKSKSKSEVKPANPEPKTKQASGTKSDVESPTLTQNGKKDLGNPPVGPDSEKMVKVKEKLEKMGTDASLPKTEPMKPKVSEPPKTERKETPKASKKLQASDAPKPKKRTTVPSDDPKTNKSPADETVSSETKPTAPDDTVTANPESPSEEPKATPTPQSDISSTLEMTKSAKVPPMMMANKLEPIPPDKPRMLSAGNFRTMLVDHLKANEQAVHSSDVSVSGFPAASSAPKMRATVTTTRGKQPEPTMSLPAVPSGPPAAIPPLKLSKKQRKDAKKLLRKHQHQLLVAQVDTQLLREQGFKVKEDSTTTTVICNTDGGIEQVLDGVENPEQIKEFLGGRYNIVSKGTGYLSVPGGEESDDSEPELKQKSIEPTKPKLETAASSTWDLDSGSESGDGLSGFPLTSKWRKDKRDKFKKVLMKGLGKAIPIEQPPALRRVGPPKDELEELEAMEEPEQEEKVEEKEEKKEGKRHRKNERKKAEKLKREEEKERLKTGAEKPDSESKTAEQSEVVDGSSDSTQAPQRRQKPKDPPINPKVYHLTPMETLGLTPLKLTTGPSYITLQDMEDVESKSDKKNTSPGTFVYKVSIPNGGKNHPFRDIYKFAKKRRHDLDVMIEVSEIYCSKNHEDQLCLQGKPGRISYNCKLNVCELRAPYGKELMSATLPIRPGYPDLPTLDSLFSEGPVSFAKLAAEASRRTDEKPYQFDFGVSTDETNLYISPDGRKRIENFIQSRELPDRFHMQLLEREMMKRREKDKKASSKKESDKRKKSKTKRPAEKAETEIAKPSSIDDIDETLHPPVPPPAAVESSKSSTPASADSAVAQKLPSKSDSLSKLTDEKPVTVETKPSKKKPVSVSVEQSVVPESKKAPPPPPPAPSAENDSSSASADAKSKSRKTARDKFRRCENCDHEIVERIQLCSGCKKVAYCNIGCQKTHWKQHKKACSYGQKKE